MSYSIKRPDSGAVLTFFILFVMLCYFVAFGIINFMGFETFITGDMYEDTLVAKLMWEQKTLFPFNYYFGNQFYVIASPVLAALFYGLTGNLNLSMALATTVMSLLVLVSLNWMLKPFVKQVHLRYAALLAMLASIYGPSTIIREDGQIFFVLCSYYSCYVISFFFLAGDYARAREDESLRPTALILALLLSFCTGMQSLRQTCVSMLPILCFEFLCAFFRLIKKEALWPKGKRMALIRAFSYLAANASGILFVRVLDIERNEIYYSQSIFSGASLSDKLYDIQVALVTVTGYDFTRSWNTPFFKVYFLFFTLIVAAAGIMILRGKCRSKALSCFWWICVISVCAVIAASLVTSIKLRDIYLFTYHFLPAISLIILLQRIKKPLYRNVLLVSLCTLCFANIFFSYGKEIKIALDEPDHPFRQISEFAVENGYEYVYGNQSLTAPAIAAHSNGTLTAGCWTEEVIFMIAPVININDIYGPEDYQKAIFVFQPWELKLAKFETEANGTELYFQGQFGDYSVYTTSRQLLYPRELYLGDYPF